MTQILILPDDSSMIVFQSKQAPDELVDAINQHRWSPPARWKGIDLSRLHAQQLGSLVVVTAPGSQVELADIEKVHSIKLSPRQSQVLEALADGLTTKQIAMQLGLHPRTIQMHIASLKARFNAQTRAQSVSRAMSAGIYSKKSSD